MTMYRKGLALPLAWMLGALPLQANTDDVARAHGRLAALDSSEIEEENREPDSPKGEYKFKLTDIQAAVREAAWKADALIQQLEKKKALTSLAQEFFKDYMGNIGGYNLVMPKVANLEESFRTEIVIAQTLRTFKEKFPNLIYDKSAWFFNSVGGIYANTIILYCSAKEYIVIWGTSLKAHGKFSGYYPYMNEFDVMMRGEMLSHDVDLPGHAPVIYKPVVQNGVVSDTVDSSNLKPRNVRSYTLKPFSYMVSYAQGNMIKAFGPGAVWPGLFVNQDYNGLWLHIKECVNAYSNSSPTWMEPFKAIKRAGRKFQEKVVPSCKPKEGVPCPRPSNYRALDVVDEFLAKSAATGER